MTRRKRTLDELTGYTNRGGYVYAVLLGTGIVRVGRTDDARTAVRGLRKDARAHGTDLADWWVSVPHEEWVANERALIECCLILGGKRTAPGCYSGADFALLTGKAHDLSFTSTAGWEYGRVHRRRPDGQHPDRRMAEAVSYRAGGLTVRDIAARLGVSHTTIVRDLARWERVKDAMPLDIIRLSRAGGTSAWNTGQTDASSRDPQFQGDVPEVIPFRRLA